MRMMRDAVNGGARNPIAPAKMEHIWNTKGSEENETPVNPWISMN